MRIIIRDVSELPKEQSEQISYDVKVERSGFIPRSIEIKRMEVQGELNKIYRDYEVSKLLGNDVSDLDAPVPVLHFKDLDRDGVIKAARQRFLQIDEDYKKELSDYQKKEVELRTALDFYYKHRKEEQESDNIDKSE